MLFFKAPLQAMKTDRLGFMYKDQTESSSGEAIFGCLRGLASMIEYGIKNDNSMSAHGKRILISMVRVIHGMSVLWNHRDFKEYYPSTYHHVLLSLDSVEMWTRVFLFFSKNRQPQKNIVRPSKSTLLPMLSEFAHEYILPAIESIAAIYFASAPAPTIEDTKLIFTAESILMLVRICQIGLNQEKNSEKIIAGSVALALAAHSLYQLNADGSNLNTWIDTWIEKKLNIDQNLEIA